VQPDWAYCQQCAADLRQGGAAAASVAASTCRRCQAALLADATFCGACGAPTRRSSPEVLKNAGIGAALLLVAVAASVLAFRWWRSRPIDLSVSTQEQVLATLPKDVGSDSGAHAFHLEFSLDGRRVAYSLGDQEAFEVYAGEVLRFRSKPPRFVGEAALTADGRRFAFSYSEEDVVATKMYAVIDGVKSSAYDRVLAPRFSQNGRRVGFKAVRDGQVLAVIDRQEIESGREGFDSRDTWVVGVPVFSEDGARNAHVTHHDGKYALIVDGRAGGETFTGFGGPPSFSPDGRNVAYVASNATGWVMVVGDQRSQPQPGRLAATTAQPLFSRDGRRVVFPVQVDGAIFLYEGGRAILGPFDFISHVAISADGRHLACLAGNRQAAHIWLDGQQLPTLPAHFGVRPVFSPVEAVVAYPAHLEGGPGVAFSDGRVLETGNINTPWVAFSADGTQIGYGEISGRQLWWRVRPVPAATAGGTR
jgi:hypothetical protein